jgi:hypothetical protein
MLVVIMGHLVGSGRSSATGLVVMVGQGRSAGQGRRSASSGVGGQATWPLVDTDVVRTDDGDRAVANRRYCASWAGHDLLAGSGSDRSEPQTPCSWMRPKATA